MGRHSGAKSFAGTEKEMVSKLTSLGMTQHKIATDMIIGQFCASSSEKNKGWSNICT